MNLNIPNFGTSQPKMPFIFYVQERNIDYTIQKVTVNAKGMEMLDGAFEIGTEGKFMRVPFTVGKDVPVNLLVKTGQLVHVVLKPKQFVPTGISGSLDLELDK